MTSYPPDWTPRYIVSKGNGVGGPPIPPDEPVLVIRGQDVLALQMLDHYLALYARSEFVDPAVASDLSKHRDALVVWRRNNRDRIKAADR